jgi:addiction module HigA family antidote
MLLEEFLRPLGISQSAFAQRIGVSFPRLNEIIHGRRGVTADTALRLERALEMPADFWLNLQARWELWHVLHGPAGRDIRAVRPVRQIDRSARSRRP